ncbi:hypothetical protein [Duganella radicis]|uniref:Uncharacterized protein n=1 Tax=Duganella radicis TaxID=551988 RepID=A0A6L6PPH7_9BURK|nr:hypothetical protein [Duganella radicis]MTV40812.1 hypothetical protein [Duganella radicis]
MKIWMENRTKSMTVAVSMAVACSLVAPAADAVTPDRQFALSGIWTQAKLLKEYIDWRASTGWGAVGATNILITKLMGESEGAMTKAAFQEMCGTTAAGLLANWKPASEPTAASHIKAIVKSAGTAAASTACGWVSKIAFDKINSEIPKAQNFMNHTATQQEKSNVANTAAETNNQLLAMEAAMKSIANAYNDHKANQDDYNTNCGGSNANLPYCSDIRNNLRNSQKNFDLALASFNRHGTSLRNDMVTLNNQIRS